MFTLRCGECGEVLQRLKVRTEQNTEAGVRALAYHAFNQHTLHRLEAWLEYNASLLASGKVTMDQLEDLSRPRCPTCKDTVTSDSFRYVRKGNRTWLCCSDRCMDAALA